MGEVILWQCSYSPTVIMYFSYNYLYQNTPQRAYHKTDDHPPPPHSYSQQPTTLRGRVDTLPSVFTNHGLSVDKTLNAII